MRHQIVDKDHWSVDGVTGRCQGFRTTMAKLLGSCDGFLLPIATSGRNVMVSACIVRLTFAAALMLSRGLL
jgi:hypothetical protein